MAVEFRTDWMNMHSRAAIERLGAKQDGVLRQQSLRKGYVRDTVVYSVLATEWPAVKLGLEYRVERAIRRAAGGAGQARGRPDGGRPQGRGARHIP